MTIDLLFTLLLVPLTLALVSAVRKAAPRIDGAVLLLAVGLLALALCAPGCTRSDQLRGLTVMVTAATVSLGPIEDQIRAEEMACLSGERAYVDAKACVEKSRAKWAPALAGIDVLADVGQTALDGEPDLWMALRAYCDLRAVWSRLPAPPAVIGGCP